MNIVAYTALHYGVEYLEYAIRSVINSVDEYVVLYSASGSHGHTAAEPCPDTRHDLMHAARRAAGYKLRWIDGNWTHEGQQRDAIYRHAASADVVLTLDADEVWASGLAQAAIDYAIDEDVHDLRVPMVHYWRSFHRAVLHDPAFPVRVVNRRGQHVRTLPPDNGVINHFGYAQNPEVVRYKLQTHGHKNEFRRDCDWYSDVFLANRQVDCHPVGSEYWNPEPVNPLDYMPDWMQSHPNFAKDII